MTNSVTMSSGKVKAVVQSIRNLPTPPRVFHQIQKLINDPNSSATQVAAVLSEDPAMSVKVLKLTNSAFYGLSRQVESVRHAVQIVGMEAVRNLVLSASVMEMFKGKGVDQEYQDGYWRHSLATAFCCRLLARLIRSKAIIDPETAFSAGLLHDVGKLVISCFLTQEFAALNAVRKKRPEFTDAELEKLALGYTHADIGGVLAETWKLPRRLREAIVFHHNPRSGDNDTLIAYVVHVANHVAKITFADPGLESPATGALEDGVLDALNLQVDDLLSASETLKTEYVKAETFMQMVGLG